MRWQPGEKNIKMDNRSTGEQALGNPEAGGHVPGSRQHFDQEHPMSESESSPVFMFDGDDPEIQEACNNARATFRYFWREIAWEQRRIVPALDLACVKAPFSDEKDGVQAADDSEIEQMWFNEIDFDGKNVSGVLLNNPNALTSVKAGDSVCMPLREISDWMYCIDNDVYGAYTVNVIRSRMDRQERRDHDEAWGLNFGDPKKIRVVPSKKSGGLLKSLFSKNTDEPADEHPMSEAMAPSLKDNLAKDRSMVHEKDERGWTLLHHLALAGSLSNVKVLLEHGADPGLKTDQGATAEQLARALGWNKVVALLQNAAAR
jgi:uncharacterized protein